MKKSEAIAILESLIPHSAEFPNIEKGPAKHQPRYGNNGSEVVGKVDWKKILEVLIQDLEESRDPNFHNGISRSQDYFHHILLDAESRHGSESSDGSIVFEYDLHHQGLKFSYYEEWYPYYNSNFATTSSELREMLEEAITRMNQRMVSEPENEE
jgi:hypothetical protein